MTFGDSITQFSVVAAVLLIAVALYFLFPSNQQEWHVSGNRMRRKVKGVWQYREMTDAEALSAFDEKVW